VGEGFIRVERCDMDVGGGFRAQDGVVICHNHLAAQEEINHALTHELIHAYDHCRAQNLDWTDCKHHACSEIRAASLSGDCKWRLEAMRGHFGLRGQHQKCVRRRAQLSVAMNPYCGGAKAAAAVDKVFDSCFADTAPFDRRP
jgi:inner membrane protease ATP23